MEKYIVTNINNGLYTIQNQATKEEKQHYFTFYNLEEDVKVGDEILISKELFDKKYKEFSREYFFGDINSKYGRKITSLENNDVITIIKKDKKFVLKRFYG